jgi:YVTN family beta-propeller protein
VWVCNRDNGTVAVIDIPTATKVAEIPVGQHPRSLAFNATGTRLLVANQRGDIPVDVNFVTPFTGTELRGSVSVINTATFTVLTTLTNLGVEPYGVALAPNGKYFVVSGMRSGTLKFLDAVSFAQILDHQFLRNLNLIPFPFTMADADANRDGIADQGDPRGFVIRSDSQRIYVTHHKSSYISVLQVTLDVNGIPTLVTPLTKIQTDDYPFDPVFNPTPVQTIASAGKPRFLEDIALSPDGTRALIPHVLHNVNHDVNFDFGPGFRR